jgi:hypothetical protein
MTASHNLEHRRSLATWLQGLGLSSSGLTAIAGDAGGRRYYRLSTPQGSRVVMDASDDAASVAPFQRVRALMDAAGLHVPAIHAADPDQGFCLLEDLGGESFLQVLRQKDADTAMEAAIQALVRWQSFALADQLPLYDGERLHAELDLFATWYVQRHLGVQPGPAWLQCWREGCERLVQSALAQPRVGVHRDFMARNLIKSRPSPGVIDFQDALIGPVTYDLASLLRDAFFSWPARQERHWIHRYQALAQAAGIPLPDEFTRALDWMAAQRHLKVLGIFARLAHRDGKPGYIADAPRFLDYLATELAGYDALEPLACLIAALPSPEEAR